MGSERIPLDDHDWTRLATALREVVATQIPDWTGRPGHDPGVTVAQVFAFLGEELLRRTGAIPERESEAIREVVARLASMPAPDQASLRTVRVDGVRWNEVSGLERAGPDDAVFAVGRDGEVTFGDGQHGRRPPSGSRVGVAYRSGTGDPGNVCVTVDSPWPPPAVRYVITLTPTPGLRIQAGDTGARMLSGAKRVHFFDGKLLSTADLRDEQEYHLGKRRLHNRTLHGWGVVAGLEVHVSTDTMAPVVTVAPGMALDPSGREVVLVEPLVVPIDAESSPRLVVIEYAERPTDPVPGPDPDAPMYARIEEGVAVRLVDESGGCGDGVIVGRLIVDAAGWAVDPHFEPDRVPRSADHQSSV